MTIQFSCDCGEPLAAREEHAGRAVRCTACNAVVNVPYPDGYSGDARDPSAIQSERPRARPPWSRDEKRSARDPDEESDGFNPRRQRKGGGGAILLLGALLVLLLGGGVVWYLFMHGKGPSGDFDLVPRDAQGFLTFRVADAMKTDIGKKAWDALKTAGNEKIRELEQKSGLTPDDIERVTGVSVDGQHQVIWILVQTTKPYDRARILDGLGKPAEKSHSGKTYHYLEREDVAVSFVHDRLMVFGPEPGVKRCLEQPAKAKAGELDDTLELASKGKYHFASGFSMKALAEVVAQQRGQAGLEDIKDFKSFWFNSTLGDTIDLEMGFEMTNRGRATTAVSETETGIASAKQALPMLKMMMKNEKVGNLTPDDMIQMLSKLLDSLKVKRDGSSVIITASLDTKDITRAFEGLGGAVEKVRGAATAATTLNNFKQISLAMIQHADANNGAMPARSILDPKTKQPVKLSWRVAILPHIEQEALYNQIRLNEPWDSEHNKQFWSKMPKVFEMPGLPAEQGMTAVQVFTGPNTPFKGNEQPRFPASFTDGASNTILIAEAAHAVNWMKPEDIDQVNPNNIRAALGNRTGKGTVIGLADGSVHHLSANVTNATLKLAIDPSDNMPLGPDWP